MREPDGESRRICMDSEISPPGLRAAVLGVEMLTFDHHPSGQKAVDHCEHSLAGHCCEFAAVTQSLVTHVVKKTFDACVTNPVYFLCGDGVRLPIPGARRTRLFVANKHPKSQPHRCGI